MLAESGVVAVKMERRGVFRFILEIESRGLANRLR